MKQIRWTLMLAALLLVVLPGAAALAASSPSDRLAAADTQLVNDYESGRSQAVDKLPLVMLVTPGVVTAYRYGRPTTYVVPAQASLDLKACAHAMLGFFGVFQPITAGNTSSAQWARTRRYRTLIAGMPAVILHDKAVPAGPAALAASLLTRLRVATDNALVRQGESPSQLVRDERGVRAQVNQIVNWAGTTYADAFLRTLKRVRATAGRRAWASAWAVVGTSPAATRDNLETAIMIKAMGPGALGHRLFLSQNTFDPASLLGVVSGMYYDQKLSETVFDSPFRMWRDLFAPIAVKLTGFGYYPQPAAHGA